MTVHRLIDHLDENWQRAVANVGGAAARLWSVPTHRYLVDHGSTHVEHVVALLGIDGVERQEKPHHGGGLLRAAVPDTNRCSLSRPTRPPPSLSASGTRPTARVACSWYSR